MKTDRIYNALTRFANNFGLTLDDLAVQFLLESPDESLLWIGCDELGIDCYVRLRETLNGGTKIDIYNHYSGDEDESNR